MVDADRDSMRCSGGRFAQELSATGVAVDHHMLPETFHSFLNRPQEPIFTDGMRLITDWARRLPSGQGSRIGCGGGLVWEDTRAGA